MASSTYLPLNAVRTRRRLRLGLWVCGVLLVLPVGFLIFRIYHQLRTEAFYQYQAAAIEVVTRLNERVYEVLKPESERPFDQYGFWSVPQNALVPEDTLNVSPLAQLAPKTTVPGVIGYFQVDPDGSFHSPVLPELNAEIPAGLMVLAEEDAFSRIVINLVDNAIKFSRGAERKLVEIGYRVAGEKSRREIRFFVRDFGPGIDRTQQTKLFRLFYRAENELTRTTPGTGIGLALVKELAAKMGARVDLENKDPGVELSVRFPG